MNTDLPYCPGCDAVTVPNRQGVCPWCDTSLRDQLDALTAVYEDNNNAVLVAGTFTAQVFEAARVQRRVVQHRRRHLRDKERTVTHES